MFWIQKITAYAEPSNLLSTSLGTEGHSDAGTSEKLMPSRIMAAYAITADFVAGRIKANVR